MKKYILLIHNIHTPDDAYGPYDTMDQLYGHVQKIYGDDWIYQHFHTLELKNPNELDRKELIKGQITGCLE